MLVIKYVSTNYPLSDLCKLTVIADKKATVQSTVVTKTCSSLISCFLQSTYYPFCAPGKLSVSHAWECDSITRNFVKRLSNQSRANCLFDMIGQSNMLSFYGTEKKKMLRAQRTVRHEEDLTSFRLGRCAESYVVIYQTSRHKPEGTDCPRFITIRFPERKFRDDRTWAAPRLDPGLQRLLHPSWARESAGGIKGEVSSSVFVTLGCRQL